MSFKIGETVVCIRSTPWRRDKPNKPSPVFMQQYKIIDIQPHPKMPKNTLLLFAEFPAPVTPHFPPYCGWHQIYFRPLVSILDEEKQEVSA